MTEDDPFEAIMRSKEAEREAQAKFLQDYAAAQNAGLSRISALRIHGIKKKGKTI